MGRPFKISQPLTYEELRDLDSYLVGVEQSRVRARRKEGVGLWSAREVSSVNPKTGEIRTISGKIVCREELIDD